MSILVYDWVDWNDINGPNLLPISISYGASKGIRISCERVRNEPDEAVLLVPAYSR
jgi:hypothetical protein